jgi:hypothetical protein
MLFLQHSRSDVVAIAEELHDLTLGGGGGG